MKKLSTCLVFILLLFPDLTNGDTNVPQDISENTTWSIAGNPYIISQNATVHTNATLTVEPGVEILINDNTKLIISGELIARGTPDQRIRIYTNAGSTQSPFANRTEISFTESANSASFYPGIMPDFKYDYNNNQILLSYTAGSILEYCVVEGLEWGITIENSIPVIMNCTIRNCSNGVSVHYAPEIPLPGWFYFYGNLVENCSSGLAVGSRWEYSGASFFSLISSNTFINNNILDSERNAVITIDGDNHLAFLFNNNITNNTGIGISNESGSYDISNKFVFMAHNTIQQNYQGVRLSGANILLHNDIIGNSWVLNDWENYRIYGGGIYLGGPHGIICNNSIQFNGVPSTGRGDGIALFPQLGNQFIIQRNELNNSKTDLIDIRLLVPTDDLLSYYEVPFDCENSSSIVVDATSNTWFSQNPSGSIFDKNDNLCAGTVNYLPVETSVTASSLPIESHAGLLSPEDNKTFIETVTINFNWESVPGATKYIICTFGNSFLYNKAELVTETSKTISFPTGGRTSYLRWFVVAGNETGWSMPSEIRTFYYSTFSDLYTGRVIDENGNPVGNVFIDSPEDSRLTQVDGSFEFVTDQGGVEVELEKKGYAKCRNFYKEDMQPGTSVDLYIISEQKLESIYQEVNTERDINMGTIIGTVKNEYNQIVSGAQIALKPLSGQLYYYDDKGLLDQSLTKTSNSGKFIFLNVAENEYEVTSTTSNDTFAAGLYVEENVVTIDDLVRRSLSDNPEDNANTDSGSDSGGGGGCFVKSLIE